MLDKGFSQPCHCGEPMSLLSLRTNIVINLAGVLATGVAVVLCGHEMKSMVTKNDHLPYISIKRREVPEESTEGAMIDK
jgi:hypothetical protein